VHPAPPFAEAGYRVVAPDVRGYGGSDKPHPVDAYDMVSLMGDLVGLIDAFEADQAILVGHDWGAPICWNTAALRPERVSAIACLSVPYRARLNVPAIDLWKRIYRDKFFYQVYFQEVGRAEAELEADVRTALRKIYYSISGDAPNLDSWLQRPQTETLLEAFMDPEPFPDWLTEADIEYFVENFTAGGFRGPINRYRNYERDFEALLDMGVAPVHQPSCFIAGSKDLVRSFVPNRDLYEDVAGLCPDMRMQRIIEGAGHWVQQEAPDEVNAALLEFLGGL
jgi:pimeloyl-ACP methyl ester carboxylesterase